MKGFPRPPFYVASRLDPHALFCRVPLATEAARLVRLTKAALSVFHQSTAAPPPPSAWRALFVVDRAPFDVVLHLRAPKQGEVNLAVVQHALVEELRVQLPSARICSGMRKERSE